MGPDPRRFVSRESSGSFPTAFARRALEMEPGPAPGGGRVRRMLRQSNGVPFLLGLALCGPLLAGLAYVSASRQHHVASAAALKDELVDRAHDVETELLTLSEALRSCRGLFRSSDEVTRAEFSTFTSEARGRHPAILALGWAPRVTEAGREAHEAAARREGFAAYRVSARGADGRTSPAPPSDEHFPVFFVEPMAGNEDVLGFDLASEAVRRSAIRRAIETAQPTASDPVTLFHGDRVGPGRSSCSASTSGRRETPTRATSRSGSCASCSATPTSSGTSGAARSARRGRRWTCPGRTRPSRGARSASSRSSATPNPVRRRRSSPSTRIDAAGQQYLLRATPTAQFLAAHRDVDSLLVAGLVFLGWELFALGLYQLARSWRSGAVRRQSRAVRLLLHSLSEGVVMADRTGRVQVANDAALRLLGVPMETLQTADWPARCGLLRRDGRTPCAADDVALARATRGEVVPEEELRVRRTEGAQDRILTATARPVRDEANVLQGGVMVLHDVTAQRRSEASLRVLRETEVEMRLASEVQQRLYPREAPRWDGLDVAGDAQFAVATCGDYYDFLRFADGTYVLAIGDVSGHGLGPALVMAETRAYLRSLVDTGFSLAEILQRINARLRADLSEGTFVSLLLVAIDPASRRITHASAGHPPALLFDASGALRSKLAATGPALGILDEPVFGGEPGPVLAVGDVLVLVTDGVPECPGADGELFEEEGVVDAVRRCCDRDAATILRTIQGDVEARAGDRPRRDDMTIVVCRSTGPHADREEESGARGAPEADEPGASVAASANALLALRTGR